jgi:hypothetical protein
MPNLYLVLVLPLLSKGGERSLLKFKRWWALKKIRITEMRGALQAVLIPRAAR